VLGEPCAAISTVASLCEWFGADSTIPDVMRARTTLAASGEHPQQ
jgi:hypothetical protein